MQHCACPASSKTEIGIPYSKNLYVAYISKITEAWQYPNILFMLCNALKI